MGEFGVLELGSGGWGGALVGRGQEGELRAIARDADFSGAGALGRNDLAGCL